jgi:hypothetical protein
MIVTVNNITNPGIAIDTGVFGLLQPGASKTLSIQAAVLETMAPLLVSQQAKGYITYTVALDPGTPTTDQVISSGLGGQLASPYGTGATAALATGATAAPFSASGTYYATGSTAAGLFYLSSGAMNGITAGLSYQTGNYRALLITQFATGAGSYSIRSDTFATPTAQIAFGSIPSGGASVDIPLQPGSNFQISLTNSGLIVATLYEINS